MRDGDCSPAELIEAYYQRGWTDGLPVVPPTEKSIAEMLGGAGLRGEEVIGEIRERNVAVTAEKLAINAVLAGCRPEYLPVVVAAIRGLCHPDFSYHGPASSTGGSAIVLIVNGPIARALGINSGNNAFGQGVRANATIGRAVRLVMMNVLNTRPGFLDRATLGTPGKYLLCFADALCNLGSPNLRGYNQSLIVFAGEHAELFGQNGWTKGDVKAFLIQHARRTIADLKRPAAGAHDQEIVRIVCAGGRAGSWSACLP